MLKGGARDLRDNRELRSFLENSRADNAEEMVGRPPTPLPCRRPRLLLKILLDGEDSGLDNPKDGMDTCCCRPLDGVDPVAPMLQRGIWEGVQTKVYIARKETAYTNPHNVRALDQGLADVAQCCW